jgi:hypothetical protein
LWFDSGSQALMLVFTLVVVFALACRTLAIFDNSGDKKLSKEEFKAGFQDYGLEMNLREVDELFGYFGKSRC